MIRRCLLAPGLILFLGATPQAFAVTHLHRGDRPPDVNLTDLKGTVFSLAAQKDHPVVLLFGELYHERSLEACQTIQRVLADPRVAETHAACVMIAAQQADAASLGAAAGRRGVTLTVLHDGTRGVYAAYQVSVLPSVVVIDRQGAVVHALAGLSAAWGDVITDAILFGGGRLKLPQFERTLNPASQPGVAGGGGARAARLTELARQLGRGGMHDLAGEKYREALAADPNYVPALIGLGRGALQQNRLPDAEEQFRAALAIEPKSSEAGLGLAYVQAQRGGAELPKAEERVRALLAARPNDAEVHYLLGMVCEKSGRTKEAAASYRKSAELLLERGGRE